MTRLIATAAMVFTLVAAGGAAANGVRAHVSPSAGAPSTTFTVSFVAPARTGVTGSIRLKDEVTASNPAAASGCDAFAMELTPDARRGQVVRVALRPTAGTQWCAGTFEGKVLELQSPVCPPRSLCPMYLRLRTLGTFSFSVRPS